MISYYALQGRRAVPVPSDDYSHWEERQMAIAAGFDPWRVARSELGPDLTVSTVFLSLDHRFIEGPPLIFETMIFGGRQNELTMRCSTWDQAEVQHQAGLFMVGFGLMMGDVEDEFELPVSFF